MISDDGITTHDVILTWGVDTGPEEAGAEKSGGIIARWTLGIPDSPISVPGAAWSDGAW